MYRSVTALTFVAGALASGANDKENPGNSIRCTAVAFGDSETYSKNAFLNYGVELAAKTCGDELYAGVELIATDIAKAVAKAIAATYIECETTGTEVYGHGEARAKASAEASAWATAIGQGWASIETCYGCKAAIDVAVASTTDIFAKAVAESKTELEVYGAADGRTKLEKRGEVIKSVTEVVAPVLVKIIAEVKAYVDEDEGEQQCGVRVTSCTAAGVEGACCDVKAGAAAKAVETDAIAEAAAGAYAVAYSCGDAQSDAEAEVWAEAIAEAYAAALAGISSYCKATDNSSACAWAEAEIGAFAKAQAKAFAEAWAVAANGCNCEINVEATANAMETVFVEAHAAAGVDICAQGGLVELNVLAQQIKRATTTAIAKAVAKAWQDSETCGGEVKACAAAGEDNKACCKVSASGYPADVSEDANAEAVALASGFVCPGEGGAADLQAKADVFVKAIAKAIAVASIDFDVYCEREGYAGFCSDIEGWLTAHAQANARAFAEAWAATPPGCSCEVSAEFAAEKLETIYSQATQDIHRETCDYGKPWDVDAGTLTTIVEKQTAAIARAIAEVRSNGKNCEAVAGGGVTLTDNEDATEEDVPVETTTEEVCAHCVKAHQDCAGSEDSGDSVLGCCDPKFVCIRKNNKVAKCKKPGSKAAKRFAKKGFGQVLECPKGNQH